MLTAMENMIGKRFGRLVVTGVSSERASSGAYLFTTKCDCGGETKPAAKGGLMRGTTASCGCLRSELSSARKRTHGLSGHPLFCIWKAMMARCENPQNRAYARYGGRGIFVCDRWRDVSLFILDNDGKNLPGLSIDRIDNDGPYSPDNCRWATAVEQGSNKANNVLLTHGGETKTLFDWARSAGISPKTLWQRINRGWPHDLAITLPVDASNKRATMVEFRGVSAPLGVHAKAQGIPVGTVHNRLRLGWDLDRALTEHVAYRKPRKIN